MHQQHIWPGAAYHEGDPLRVEHKGAWHEATVLQIEPTTNRRFGLRWLLTVRLDDGRTIFAYCDDDGRNHTLRERVAWSDLVLA